jgi:chemotaxis protein MotB
MADEDKYIRIERDKLEEMLRTKAQELIQQKVDEAVLFQQREFAREKSAILNARTKEFERRLLEGQRTGKDSFYKTVSREEDFSEPDTWTITYSDLITLVLTLFILLFAISSFDLNKYEQVKMAINRDLLNKYENPAFISLQNDFKRVFTDFRLMDNAHIEMQPDGLKVEMPSNTVYEIGSADINQAMIPVLTQMSQAIKEFKDEDFILEVEGHTDNIPINTPQFPSNWELSSARATTIVRFFIEQGIDPTKLRAAGYADSRPLVPNVDADGNPIPENQAKNRRVVIYIKKPQHFKQTNEIPQQP